MEEPVLLFVEDDALVAMTAEAALEAGGFAIVVAASGREALDALNASPARYAGVITDIRLGDGPDGWEVARCAREHQSTVPIVYMTADSGGEWGAQGVPNSVLVQKPYAPAQLLTAIAGLITAADANRAS